MTATTEADIPRNVERFLREIVGIVSLSACITRTFDEEEVSFGIFRQYTKRLYRHFCQRRVATSARVSVNVEIHVGIGEQP